MAAAVQPLPGGRGRAPLRGECIIRSPEAVLDGRCELEADGTSDGSDGERQRESVQHVEREKRERQTERQRQREITKERQSEEEGQAERVRTWGLQFKHLIPSSLP